MKRKIIVMVLVLATLFSLSSPTFAAESINTEKISTLEKEIISLEAQYKEVSKGLNVLMGKVSTTKPYFTISGSGIGNETTLNSNTNYIIQDQDNGTLIGNFYYGSHKYLGTRTIKSGKKNITYLVFGAMPKDWRNIYDKMDIKRKELKKIKSQNKEIQLSSYIEDENNDIVFQVGNPMMCLYGTMLPIDDKGSSLTIIDGVSYIPVCGLVEALGGDYITDEGWESSTVTLDGKKVEMIAEAPYAFVDNKTVPLSANTHAHIVKSVMMMPVRFIADTFKMGIKWDSKNKILTLKYSAMWQEHLDAYLSETPSTTGTPTEYYTLKDATIGCTYSYPKSWGKPKFENDGYKDYTASYSNGLVNMTVSLVNNGISSEDLKESVRTCDYGQSEKIPLTEKNKGIEIICIFETDSGEIGSILCDKGYVIGFEWNVVNYSLEGEINHSLDELKDQMKAEVLKMVNSLEITNPNVG